MYRGYLVDIQSLDMNILSSIFLRHLYNQIDNLVKMSNTPTPTRTVVQQVQTRYQGLSTPAKIFLGILVLVALGLLIYWGVTARESATLSSRLNPIIITKPVNAFEADLGERGLTLPISNQGLEFTYSFWLYISDWSYSYGKKKYIFIKGNSTAGPGQWSPALWLGENANTLYTSMAMFPVGGNGNPKVSEECPVRDIPLQKWVHVAYILNNRNVDVYIDGKLEKSCVLDGVPNVNRSRLYISPHMADPDSGKMYDPGFYGQLANFQYFTRAIEPNVVSDIYMHGPYGSL